MYSYDKRQTRANTTLLALKYSYKYVMFIRRFVQAEDSLDNPSSEIVLMQIIEH